LLFGLMLFLCAAIVAIASAAVREGDLSPGKTATPAKVRRAHIALAIAAAVVIGVLLIGRAWWRADDARFTRRIYSPPEMNATLSGDNHLLLTVKSASMVAGNPRRPEDTISLRQLIPDHDHLMHFFMVRSPQMDSFWHLHPAPAGNDAFALDLPAVPPGHYQLFADVVLNSGFPVTMVGQLDVPEMRGRALVGDDSGINTTKLAESGKEETSFTFADGGQMVWQRDAHPLKAGEPLSFKFMVRDKEGKPARDMQPYMGMAAHAEILRSDASVFAHVHPAGSVSMAALDLAQMGVSPNAGGGDSMARMQGMKMPGMDMAGSTAASIGPEISFPYGFPKPGRYRVFVQIKRAGKVETAVFDANVN
jgi:hypothetical protein